jgi:hypothetical protein
MKVPTLPSYYGRCLYLTQGLQVQYIRRASVMHHFHLWYHLDSPESTSGPEVHQNCPNMSRILHGRMFLTI